MRDMSRFSGSTQHDQTTHFSRCLITAREQLAPVVRFTGSALVPEVIRVELERALREAITETQKRLEDDVRKEGASGEWKLRIILQTSLLSAFRQNAVDTGAETTPIQVAPRRRMILGNP